MPINEILNHIKGKRAPSRLEKILEKNGWKILGKGIEAVVAEHPNKKYVLKIFLRNSLYSKFVKYTQSHQDNKHLPKFNRYVKDIPDTEYSYVRMEKLEPLNLEKEATNEYLLPYYLYLAGHLAGFGNSYMIKFTGEFGKVIANELSKIGLNWINIKQEFLRSRGEIDYTELWNAIGKKPDSDWIRLVSDLTNIGSLNDLDLHSGNMMLRSKTLVITDPLY